MDWISPNTSSEFNEIPHEMQIKIN